MPSLQSVSSGELRQIAGDISDAQLAELLALRPTAAEIEQAVMWANNEGDIVDKGGHALKGKVAKILDILSAGEEEQEPPHKLP